MKFVVVSGSHRPQSQSNKVADYIAQRMIGMEMNAEVIHLSDAQLPFWDEGLWNGDEKWKRVWEPYSKKLIDSDGLVACEMQVIGRK